ncbi:glycosyltransferase involved in cell wall biosynthesis [Hasllibacter halocynthiae]|uniref:Glycosyltransferase involved in cell wall biosynthesis n=1 Tax=Hasllibacter halocynthiae TaxID=595589 RepID=A0A2T0X9T3_9RHOB|nr:glycosyltransferase [Hasllibacter halocynthiae]PRY95687.1 glycosyltransferase involved in cell wall biosynthesis [Hasllibacter halocynthiae]
MRIAVLAHLRHPIRPPFSGGMEAHAWHLVRGLSARGHDVTLFASGDSDPALPLAPACEEHYDQRFPWHEYHGTDVLNEHLDHLFSRTCGTVLRGRFDVVHNNSLHRFPPRLSRARRVPMISSMHVPPFGPLRRAVEDSAAPWHLTTVTSRSQMGRWWDRPPATARVLHNGIDLAAWPFRPRGDGTAVWAGRIARNKGTALAAEAATLAGMPLTILGPIEERDYFDVEVAPRLSATVRYEGHLPGDLLADALGRASVLLFTPMWDEPFGLAAIEAMATGLPVAAFDNGAVREVVGGCGAFAPPGDVPALARALRCATGLPRRASRDRVEAKFSLSAMLDACEALYAEAAAARRAALPPAGFGRLQLDVA